MAKTTKIRKFLAIALTLTLLFSLTSLSLSAAPRKECDCTCRYSCCEYGYDHSSRCQCDKCDEEEHEHGTSYSVNHIDIVVDMSATVTIDGEQKNIDFTISHADVNNNTVSVTPSVSGTAYSITGFGSDGTRDQIRINGNFPIGTQANPIRYTVSLTKTLTVDGVNVPVTLSATVGYWDNGNICPQGPRSNGALGGSQAGIDLELGNGSGSVNTQPTPSTPSTPSQPEPDPEPTTGAIQIQKTVAGAALAENTTFYFDIYDATGALFNDNVAVTVEANGTIALASVLNVPVGSYTVLEDALPTVEGYVLSGTAYSTANGSVAVNADTGYNGYVNVTNTYTAEEPPVVSSEPTVSSEPEVSSEPIVSSEPEVSSEPIVSSEPEVSSEPVVSSEPEVSSEPVVSSEPEVSSEPVVSSEPEVSSEPIVSSEPEVSSEPIVSSEPEVSSEPVVSSEPEVSSEPVVSSEPEVSSEPVVSSEPEVSSEPVVSSEPIVSSEPTTSFPFFNWGGESQPEEVEEEESVESTPTVSVPKHSYPAAVVVEELPEEDVPLADLPDEPTPLDDAPDTGTDHVRLVFLALTMMSSAGLAALAFTAKKSKENN